MFLLSIAKGIEPIGGDIEWVSYSVVACAYTTTSFLQCPVNKAENFSEIRTIHFRFYDENAHDMCFLCSLFLLNVAVHYAMNIFFYK